MKKYKCKIENSLEYCGLISIIVPIYNAEKFLEMSLQSLLMQTYQNWEAVLVNDGSTDESLEIIRKYADLDARFKFIDKKNGGVSAARNAGLDVTTGDYIAFLDPDDMLCSQFLEVMLQILLETDSDMVWCRKKKCDEFAGREVCETYKDYEVVVKNGGLECFIEGRPHLTVAVWGKLYKAKILKKLRFMVDFEVMAEDFEFSLRAFELCGKTAYVHRKMIIYRQHGCSLTHRPLSFAAVNDHIRLLQYSVWHFKDALDRKIRHKLWRCLMPIVFRYVCIVPYLETNDYMLFWRKYSSECNSLYWEQVFLPKYLPIRYKILCFLYLQKKWRILRFMLNIYTLTKKNNRAKMLKN